MVQHKFMKAMEQVQNKSEILENQIEKQRGKGTHKYRTNKSRVYQRILSRRSPFSMPYMLYSTSLPVLII
jgi:hypothetical protein